jgi:hypothetical protein
VNRNFIVLALTSACLLTLVVGCEGNGRNDSAGAGAESRDFSTTAGPEVASLDPALLGKWQATDSVPEQNADYLGSTLDFRITTDDEGDPTGQLLTPTGNGVTGYGDLYAWDGVMRFGGDARVGVVLEGTYTIEGDTLTIVPAAATGLATVVYVRVAE